MEPSPALLVHLFVGTLALVSFWLAASLRLFVRHAAAGRLHRGFGRVFFVAMLAVVASVGPLLFGVQPFDPGRLVQLVYLCLCVGAVVGLGWTSVRWRRHPERFLALPLRPVGAVLAGAGAVVLLAGLSQSRPVPIVLSWVGLAFGTALWRFRARPLPAQWWLSWHLDAVCGLFTAVHGTLLFVAWRTAVSPEVSADRAAGSHLLVLLLALGLRAGLTRRFHAPSFVFVGPGRPTSDRAEGLPLHT